MPKRPRPWAPESPKTDTKILPVVGVSFVEGYPHNLLALKELIDWQAGQPGAAPLSVILRRNPDNQYDPNAVEVHIPALGKQAFIGHFKRDHARPIAILIDSGVRFACHVHRCRILESQPQNPGIDIAVTRLEQK